MDTYPNIIVLSTIISNVQCCQEDYILLLIYILYCIVTEISGFNWEKKENQRRFSIGLNAQLILI